MNTLEFTEFAGEDRFVRLSIPVDTPGKRYRLIVQIEPEEPTSSGKPEFSSDEFISETAGQWVGELERQPQGEYEQRESL